MSCMPQQRAAFFSAKSWLNYARLRSYNAAVVYVSEKPFLCDSRNELRHEKLGLLRSPLGAGIWLKSSRQTPIGV